MDTAEKEVLGSAFSTIPMPVGKVNAEVYKAIADLRNILIFGFRRCFFSYTEHRHHSIIEEKRNSEDILLYFSDKFWYWKLAFYSSHFSIILLLFLKNYFTTFHSIPASFSFLNSL